jgi:SAM-dependent methyltransferase
VAGKWNGGRAPAPLAYDAGTGLNDAPTCLSVAPCSVPSKPSLEAPCRRRLRASDFWSGVFTPKQFIGRSITGCCWLLGGVFVAEYKYPLSNEWKGARERLSLLEAMADPRTIRNFGKVGVKEGWRCLEIAGGGGSIAEWLCHQVGGSGHVVATDLDPRFLKTINVSNLEVWCHDILREPLPMGAFDLVHARAVLVFLPQPVETISKMVAALKPGGWLL